MVYGRPRCLGATKLGTQLSFQHIGTLASLPCWALFGPKRAFLDPPYTSLKNGNGQNCFKPTSYMSEDSKSKHLRPKKWQKGLKNSQKWQDFGPKMAQEVVFINVTISCVPGLVARTGYLGRPQQPQLFHSFTVYVKGASPFLLGRIVHQY